jgi:hypothetical protein
LKKEGRGTSDYRVDESEKLIVVRWYNRTVDVRKFLIILVLILQIKFEDGKKASKSSIEVERPAIIEEYNKFMGGIDLLDSLTSLCKQKINSRRWYTHVWHTLMIAAVYSLIWYRRHCKLLNEGKTMSMYSLICNIASGLIEVKAKVGRPLGNTPPQCNCCQKTSG